MTTGVRALAGSLQDLTQRIRDFIGDASLVPAKQRWSDTKILRAINDVLFEMYLKRTDSPGAQTIQETFSYPDGQEFVALPETVANQPLFKLESLEGSDNRPNPIRRVDFHELESFVNRTEGAFLTFPQRVWALQATNIAIRPKPSGALSLRIWYIAPPLVLANDPDLQPYPVMFEELITIGARVRLLEADDEQPLTLPLRYGAMMEDWLRYGQVYRGTRYPTSKRRFR